MIVLVRSVKCRSSVETPID